MSDNNRKHVEPRADDELNSLKQEVAEELHLDDDIESRGWENMTTREVGKIGGNMVRKMVGFAEREMDRRGGRISSHEPGSLTSSADDDTVPDSDRPSGR
ncbi:MAG: small, acid-soluble spore protein, alpha/beta type [Chloroflexota bacterium]